MLVGAGLLHPVKQSGALPVVGKGQDWEERRGNKEGGERRERGERRNKEEVVS